MAEPVNYRLEYSKMGCMKFIGHIDLMKLYHKLFRMSGLPVVFSQGFNPHQIFTIAHPLSLGMEGTAEIADFRLSAAAGGGDIADALSAKMPQGLSLTGVRPLETGEKNCAGLVAAADYTVTMGETPGLSSAAASILARAEVITSKRTKSGTSQQDIRPDIHTLTASDSGAVHMRISAGSTANLKPQLVVSEIFRELGLSYDEHASDYRRTRLLCRQGGAFAPIL